VTKSATEKPGIEGLKSIAELAKQIITLGSALIGVTVTFADKFREVATPGVRLAASPLLGWAWIAFVASILFAVLTLMAVTGSLNEIDQMGSESQPERGNTKIWAAPMLLSFLIGLILTAIAGWGAVH